MEQIFTPKQVAGALGVSESTIKRWVDSGRIQAGKTVGGHRKLELSAIVSFVRDTGQAVPFPEKIGLAAVTTRTAPSELQESLYEALLAGDEPGTRNLVLGLYQHGEPIARVGDELIGPVFQRIGHAWASGELSVHQERRCCTTLLATIYGLRQLIPAAKSDAPLALCVTPSPDFAEVPIRLVELAVLDAGWRSWMCGAALPLDEVQAAIRQIQPQMVCVSVSHAANCVDFVQQFNETIAETCTGRAKLVVGGSIFTPEDKQQLRCDVFCEKLSDLTPLLAPEHSE